MNRAKQTIQIIRDLRKKFMVIGSDWYELSKFNSDYEGIEYCNLGGGFLRRITMNDAFFDDYESGKIRFTNKIPSQFIYGKICCEGMDLKFVKGYYNPIVRWNGWINPYFTWEACKEINASCDDDNLLFRFYDEEVDGKQKRTLEYSNQYDSETPFVIPSQKINGIEVYDCGLGICWELYK